MKNDGLYQAILERHSVRQYQQEMLTEEQLSVVKNIAAQCHPLLAENSAHFQFINNLNTVDVITAQGPYGSFISSPHVVLPYCIGNNMPLVEIGFRAEQFCVHLYEMGLGTCYLGTAGREKGVIHHFNLPEGSEMGAAIIYGNPQIGEKRSIGNYFRKPGKRTRRKPMGEIFFVDSYGHNGILPPDLEPILTAAQAAPSAVNAQPWRFIMANSWLYLYVMPSVYPFVLSGSNKMMYALHDAGIVMANISLAYEAHENFRNWVLIDTSIGGYPSVPAGVVPVAKIKL